MRAQPAAAGVHQVDGSAGPPDQLLEVNAGEHGFTRIVTGIADSGAVLRGRALARSSMFCRVVTARHGSAE
jgi:hypothetical protein